MAVHKSRGSGTDATTQPCTHPLKFAHSTSMNHLCTSVCASLLPNASPLTIGRYTKDSAHNVVKDVNGDKKGPSKAQQDKRAGCGAAWEQSFKPYQESGILPSATEFKLQRLAHCKVGWLW